jgi:pyruvyltransferase
MWDADDRVNGTIPWPEPMDADEYGFVFKSGSMVFRRTQMFNNRKKWKYTGVIHEYAECMEARLPYRMIEGDYSFSANSLGARALDPRKYEKDAEVLEKAYYEALENKDPIHCRYAFYCANSYRNTSNKAKTEEFYKKTLRLEGWLQEKYMSCLELFSIYEAQDKAAEGIPFLLQSTKYDKTRVECVYRLIKHYCLADMFDVAINHYGLVKDWYENQYIKDDMSSRLFARLSEHDFYMPYYLIIAAERVRNYALGYKMYQIVWQRKYTDVGEWWIHNLIHNMQFFVEHADPRDLASFQSWVLAIRSTSTKLSNKHESTLKEMEQALTSMDQITDEPTLTINPWNPINNEWTFYESYDSCLNDIRCEGPKPLQELINIATKQPNCVAFNTLGWLKYNVTYPLRKVLNSPHGVFVRRGYTIEKCIPTTVSKFLIPVTQNKRALVVELRNYHFECLGVALHHLYKNHSSVDTYFPSANGSEWLPAMQSLFPNLQSLPQLKEGYYDTLFFLTSHDHEEFATFLQQTPIQFGHIEGITHMKSMEIRDPSFKNYGLTSLLPYPVLSFPTLKLPSYSNTYETDIPLFTVGTEAEMDLASLDIELMKLNTKLLFLTKHALKKSYTNIVPKVNESDSNLFRCLMYKRAILWTPPKSSYTTHKISGLLHSAASFQTPLVLRSDVASHYPQCENLIPIDTLHHLKKALQHKRKVSLRYYNQESNFGDQLSPFITESLMNKDKFELVHNDEHCKTSLISIGSFLQKATDNTFVFGSGIRTDPPIEPGHDYTQLNVSAVRGPLTKSVLEGKGIRCPSVFGDPALLLPRFYTPAHRKDLSEKIALIPHFTQYESYKTVEYPFHLINPGADWRSVINELCSCKAVVSSSLHGLICADAYRIPNVWLTEIAIAEADFKFRDYFASQGRPIASISTLTAFKDEVLYKSGNTIDLDTLVTSFPF